MIRPVVVLLAAFTLLLGVVYPAAITGIARAAFPDRASGSPLAVDGRVVGSALVGQPFSGPRSFWPRPSATSPAYDALASGGSNLGPTSPELLASVERRVAALRAAHPEATGPVPVDLVTSSGSGLDPHLSPGAALVQVERVARARGLPAERVRALVLAQVEPRLLGFLGAPRVNVLRLNVALDGIARD
jgi:K+-transporting ATPase ATPase C chain